MLINQFLINDQNDFSIYKTDGFNNNNANLVLVFSDRVVLEKKNIYQTIRGNFPNAEIVFCSTSGHFSNNRYVTEEIVVTAIEFNKTQIQSFSLDSNTYSEEIKNNSKLSSILLDSNLKGLLVFSEGSTVNGTELINLLSIKTNNTIPIFGGIAGDMERFSITAVGLNDEPKSGKITLIGFYGNSIRFGFGCKGGWHDFGPEREVTQSDKTVLFKIGNQFALDIYKEYLGEYAAGLPATSLYFPLAIKTNENEDLLVRTVLSIDEKNKSMTFAGEIPLGSKVKFMKSNSDNLLDAAFLAAEEAYVNKNTTQLALAISCVGRKLVLGNRHDEEFETIKETLGNNTIITGFYSYGEIAPKTNKVACDLNNQTMTITTIYEE